MLSEMPHGAFEEVAAYFELSRNWQEVTAHILAVIGAMLGDALGADDGRKQIILDLLKDPLDEEDGTEMITPNEAAKRQIRTLPGA